MEYVLFLLEIIPFSKLLNFPYCIALNGWWVVGICMCELFELKFGKIVINQKYCTHCVTHTHTKMCFMGTFFLCLQA